MSSFDRWQEAQRKRIVANKNLNAKFVINGFPTIQLTCKMPSGTISTLMASVVNKQEKDLAYIYTNENEKLQVGTLCNAKGLMWLISDEIIMIKDVGYNKYPAYLCNVQIGNNYGFFKGPEKTYINVTMQKDFAIISQQKPVLVMAGDPYGINDKVLIKDRAWMIQEKDNISSDGITYYSLSTTTMSKDALDNNGVVETANDTNVEITDPQIVSGVKIVNFETDITLTTENGYFNATEEVNIKSLSSTSVTFTIPYGIKNEITVSVKSNGSVVTSIYKAVI